MPSVTVIVPIFDGVAFLPTFFASLQPALPDGAQLILIDDGSTEPVWDAVPEIPRAGAIIRLRNEANLGYAVAVNRGFAAATGDIVIQLNTDLVLEPDCVGAMVELIGRELEVGIVGSKLVYPTTGLVQHVGMAFGNHTKLHVFSELAASHPLCNRTRELQIVTGATVAMTRATLDQLGPLEERYFNHNEDIEHCLIAVGLGLRNFICAESVAYHWESQSGPARFAQADSSEALFWSRWGAKLQVDLGRFVDEALEHILSERPELENTPFELLDLSRGPDQPIVAERLAQRWPTTIDRSRRHRQLNNPAERLSLPLLLPHWVVGEPVPLIYLTDRYRALEENAMWFETRRQVVAEELVVDLTGVVLTTAELARAT